MGQYQIGDKAIDRNGRIFEVESIAEKDFGSGPQPFLVMKPCFQYEYSSDYRFYVPQDNASNILHAVMSPDECNRLIDGLAALELYPETTPRERKMQFQNIVASGNRKDICRVIKSLAAYKKKRLQIKKTFSDFDNRLLQSLKTMLKDEISLALSIPVDRVFPYIEDRTGVDFFQE